MSFIPTMNYLIGLAVFGFAYWILDGILDMFIEVDVHVAGTTFDVMHMLWTASLIVYIIFGGWWLIRKYNERNMYGGY